MWGANTFPSRNRLPYPISRSQDRDFSLLRFSRCLPFPTCGIKDVRWRLHCLMIFSRLFQLATSLGNRSTKCWSIPESILALVCFLFGCLFYRFAYLSVCIASYVRFTFCILDLAGLFGFWISWWVGCSMR